MKSTSRIVLFGGLWLAVMVSQTNAQPKLEELGNNPKLFLETARTLLKWDEPAEAARIVGPIYFVGTKGLSVFLITGSDGHIVINTGMPGSGPMIEKSIRTLGFKPEDVKLLLAGHAHIDHVGGHASLQKISGAKIALIREEKDLFESGGKLDFHYGHSTDFGFDPAHVETVFNDGDEIKLGNITITALLTNGHTRGSTTFVTRIMDDGQTYSVVFPTGTSVNPGYRVTTNPSYPGIGDDFRRTLHVLETLEPDIWLGAHNESYDYAGKLARSKTLGSKAWLDAEGYKQWVALQRKNFQAALEREAKAEPKPE